MAAVLEAIRPLVRPGAATAFSLKFSPFLGIGSLSVRRIWQELLRYQAP
jgi:deoxyribodipyrimidine photolyase